MNENNLVRNNNIEFLKVPLGTEAHHYAAKFAAEQRNPQKGKQIYLNTLAVYAVHRYLDWINVETDLNQNDSWQSITRMLFNIADLVLPRIGKLECRLVMPDEELIHLPIEVRRDRIGYLAVKFSQQLDQVELLGYVRSDPAIEVPEEIRLAELRPLNDLINHIDWIESGKVVHLQKWLEQVYEPGWQESAKLISVTRFKSSTSHSQSINRAKQIDNKFDDQVVALLVQLTSTNTENFKIRVRLCPTAESPSNCLPRGIQLLILNDNGVICMQRQVEEADSWIEHEFTGKVGEQFSVRVVLEDISCSENFVI